MAGLRKQLVKSASHLNLSRFKNQPAEPGRPYVPTTQEHVANIVSHLLVIPAAVFRMRSLVGRSADGTQAVISAVYCAAGLCLFLVSSLFHLFAFRGGPCVLKEIFHRGDRVIIYVFIAASYTPWLVLRDYEFNTGIWCLYIIWLSALLGITYQLMYHEKHKWLEVTLYLAIGIAPGLVVGLQMKNPAGLAEMSFGGAVYVSGVVFFKLDGVVPFAHAIWHLFVVAGAVVHFEAVATHLVGHVQDDLGF